MEKWRMAMMAGQWVVTLGYLFRANRVAPQLPEKMATHFGFNGEPDGWGSKRMFLWVTTVIVIVNSVISTVLLAALRQLGWMAGAVELIATLTLVAVCWQAMDFNVSGKRLKAGTIIWPVVAILGLTFYQLSRLH